MSPRHALEHEDPRHGSRRGYDLGCRCFPCALAQSRYQREWAANGPTRVPAEVVSAHIELLVESGWTRQQIQWETGMGNSGCWYIQHRARGVNRATADKILALEPWEPERTVWLDVDPLEAFVHRSGKDIVELMQDESLRRAWYRAVDSGRISDLHADRIAVRCFGHTLEEIYGPDWDDQSAAA